MDIDLLWSLGGWFLIFPDICMATLKTPSPTSQIPAKSQLFLVFLSLLFIFLVLVHSADSSTPSTTITATATATMDLNPKRTQSSRPSSSTRREFGAKAHEVPSGPNPISNR
ncbi:similar to CLAVATA3/ESR-RELATED 41 [Actinidia rufa]|uniref:Similar to CLAVATA3/ESR-RELATED 41 n=1 Tax=Actinidia rufa TaxID=165716 RepID=A0A7J0H3E1_9ERIC|nr:similar to CLAVATA3/ESR-RELATED 41 [Actinidia rufa]